MNLLNKCELWLSELGIRVNARATCLAVNRNDVENLTTADELLKEIRSLFGTNKFYWSHKDDGYYYLSDFI